MGQYRYDTDTDTDYANFTHNPDLFKFIALNLNYFQTKSEVDKKASIF